MLIWLLWQYDRAVSGESVSAVSHHCRHIPPIVRARDQCPDQSTDQCQHQANTALLVTRSLEQHDEAATAQIGCNDVFVSLDSGMMPSNHSKVSHGALAAPPYSLWTLLLFFPLNMKYTCSLPFTTNKEKNVQDCFGIYVLISKMATTHNAIVTNTSWHLVSLSLAPLHFLQSAFHPRPAVQTDILSPILSDREFDSAPFIPTLLFSAAFYGAVRGGGRICGNI